ncbi:MAG: 50S ribosomal protein L6 [Deltaproteobacteria bacterium]|nr:50S ribosomal protein L6 [Deltaproteobacteria bacterium]
MSRVGKKPILIPDKTKVLYKDGIVTVEGQKGTLARSVHPLINLEIKDGVMNVIMKEEGRVSRSLQGLTISLVSNMLTGVTKGFERVLEINGIGYRAMLSGNHIVFNLGYSHPIDFDLPKGISASIEKNNIIKLSGIDKEQLGQISAAIRRLRPPEPYKGKGIKYAEEYIRRKAGKTGAK